MTTGYVVYILAGRSFGVNLGAALEIIPWQEGKQVPLAYSYVEGILDYRGRIYPVFNIEKRLGLKPLGPIGFTASGPENASTVSRDLLLLEENGTAFGIAVDSVQKMAQLDQIVPAQSETQGIAAQYIRGLAYEDNREIIILDFERLLFHGC